MEQKYVIAYGKKGMKNFFVMLHSDRQEISPRCSFAHDAQHFSKADVMYISRKFKEYWGEHELVVHNLRIELGDVCSN